MLYLHIYDIIWELATSLSRYNGSDLRNAMQSSAYNDSFFTKQFGRLDLALEYAWGHFWAAVGHGRSKLDNGLRVAKAFTLQVYLRHPPKM